MIEWFVQNKEIIGTVIGILLMVASAITGMTKTPTDDKVVDFIRNLLGRLSLVKYSDASGSVKMPLKSASDPEAPIMMERASFEDE